MLELHRLVNVGLATVFSLKNTNLSNLWSFSQKPEVFEELGLNWKQVLKADCGDLRKAKKVFRQWISLHHNKKPANFLPAIIVLVEGATEQVLLPCLARLNGIDLLEQGALIIPAHGAKKMLREYLYWKKCVNLPIFCIFDRDAHMLAGQVSASLRESDHVYILADGEFEDLMRLNFLVDQVNQYFAANPLYDSSKPVSVSHFMPGKRRTVVLDKIWRQKELGKFEKVKFAQFIAEQSHIGHGMSGSTFQEFLSNDCEHMLDSLIKSIGSTPVPIKAYA